MAGELMTAAARKSGAEILPVDSEHNAIHQCLRGEKASEVRRLILTASGGPFLNKSTAEIENATRDEALNHPKWKMGEKITIDSATLMNKGLEVIEARWLFDFDAERIDVLVHPQSIVHSMVEMIDGSVIAQMGVTDMQHAIQYALTFPERRAASLPPLDLATLSELNFEAPDLNRFPCLGLAYKALRAGGTMPAVLNAANETAVAAFLDGRIRLPEIAEIIGSVLSAYDNQAADSIETVLAADRWARESATMRISGSLSPATAATGSHV
jgi:1-deoxy-D-xylulose-5-phosphate reductoisomerase